MGKVIDELRTLFDLPKAGTSGGEEESNDYQVTADKSDQVVGSETFEDKSKSANEAISTAGVTPVELKVTNVIRKEVPPKEDSLPKNVEDILKQAKPPVEPQKEVVETKDEAKGDNPPMNEAKPRSGNLDEFDALFTGAIKNSTSPEPAVTETKVEVKAEPVVEKEVPLVEAAKPDPVAVSPNPQPESNVSESLESPKQTVAEEAQKPAGEAVDIFKQLEKTAPMKEESSETDEDEETVEALKNPTITDDSEVIYNKKFGITIVDGKICWKLDCPCSTYDSFYEAKRSMMENIMSSGYMPFAKYRQTLSESSNTNVTLAVYDPKAIHSKMEDIQKWRDTVTYIMMQVNSQYQLLNRASQLLQGLLARVHCAKPIAKQEGVVLEHMGDTEYYLAELKSLHHSTELSLKNLDTAFDVLSRKLTIALLAFDKTDYQVNRSNAAVRTQSTDESALKDFDALSDTASAAASQPIQANHESKTGRMSSWSDITEKRALNEF